MIWVAGGEHRLLLNWRHSRREENFKLAPTSLGALLRRSKKRQYKTRIVMSQLRRQPLRPAQLRPPRCLQRPFLGQMPSGWPCLYFSF